MCVYQQKENTKKKSEARLWMVVVIGMQKEILARVVVFTNALVASEEVPVFPLL